MWLLLLLAALAALSTINIYATELGSSTEIALGTIDCEPLLKTATFLATPPAPLGLALCLGTHDLPHHSCFVYHESANGVLQGKFQLFVDATGVQRVSFGAAADVMVDIVEVVHSPAPDLKPFLALQNLVQPVDTKTVLRKSVVTDEAGAESVVEEMVEEVVQPDTRSWVQKNWMYIVPPLILLFITAPVNESPAQ